MSKENDNKKKLILMILDTIHDAIDQKKQISFTYNSYGTDFKLHPKWEREYIYMYGGESIYVKFRARKDCMTEYVDWLGTNFKIMSEDETQIMDLRQSQCVI